MTNKLVVTALGAMVAVGVGSQAVAANPQTPVHKKFSGYQKRYALAKADMNDCTSVDSCDETEHSVKHAWLGLPKGTCSNIVGIRTEDLI